MKKPASNKPEAWALYYASLGLAVVPIIPGTKRPPMKSWQQDASTDPEKIRSWWSRWPDYGVGFVTGEKSGGVVVTDLDYHPERGIDGPGELEAWESVNGKTEPTWEAVSGSGGVHRFYIAADNPPRSQHLINGQVDFQADGALIVLPPTIHPKTGKPYTWRRSPQEAQIATFDGLAKDFIEDAILEAPTGKNSPVFTAPEEIPEGERVGTLIRMIGSLVNKGLSNEAIEAAIRAENEKKCSPVLTEEELQGTIFPAIGRFMSHQEPQIRPERQQAAAAPSTKLSTGLCGLGQIQEEDPDWLIPGYVPKYQITSLAGDGGAGKTTIWCGLAAAISSGRKCFMEQDDLAPDRAPGKVLFFSAEDSLKYTLARRLRKNGANLDNIFSMDISDKRFAAVKFNSKYLEQLLDEYRPTLCIFDPIQSFVPPDIKMGDRNAMRQCLEPLIGYGERFGTTFLVVEHANKMAGAYGRKRIADSADIWDISRSVLMAGETNEEGIRYLSHEKSNYGPLQTTILYELDNERAEYTGESTLRDRDYILGAEYGNKLKPQRESAKELLLDTLKGTEKGEIETAELDDLAKAAGISKNTWSRAKADLKSEGEISYRCQGNGKDKKFFTIYTHFQMGE